jgi:AcrR family transcriptional regulator
MDQNSENSTLSRKEREKKSRQEEILNAARQLFSQKGYHETTLEEIAHKAEFAKGTIYNYFANKDELFFGIVDNIFETLNSIAASTMSREGLSVREKLTVYAKEIMRFAHGHADLFKIMMREAPRPSPDEMDKRMMELQQRDEEARGFIMSELDHAAAEGRLRPIDTRQTALLFDGMVKFYCMHCVKHAEPRSEEDIERNAELIVSILFDGIQQP